MPGTHAVLSPSAAHRWLHCTAAPRLEEHVEDRGSSYAEEGTLAHAYCAKHLKEYLSLPTTDEDKEIVELNDTYHTGEMDEATAIYRTIVLDKYEKARERVSDAQLLVEVRLDFTQYIPDGFGTADAVIIADGTMEIIDFKFGKGVKVNAANNPQMMIYALGAYQQFSFEYNISKVQMTIVQPRIDNLSEWSINKFDLLAWATYCLQPKAREAFDGKGHQEPGEWCQFCKVKASCKALADQTFAVIEEHPDPMLISPEDMAAKVLPMLDTIKTWIKGVDEYTLQQALSGTKYEGYKLVAGRSVRKITDVTQVIAALSQEYDEAAFMKPRELKSITDLEKICGKKHFNELCADWIDKPVGKPTLVPASDKREELNTDDFAGVNLSEE